MQLPKLPMPLDAPVFEVEPLSVVVEEPVLPAEPVAVELLAAEVVVALAPVAPEPPAAGVTTFPWLSITASAAKF